MDFFIILNLILLNNVDLFLRELTLKDRVFRHVSSNKTIRVHYTINISDIFEPAIILKDVQRTDKLIT